VLVQQILELGAAITGHGKPRRMRRASAAIQLHARLDQKGSSHGSEYSSIVIAWNCACNRSRATFG